jgi:hypothetical protein
MAAYVMLREWATDSPHCPTPSNTGTLPGSATTTARLNWRRVSRSSRAIFAAWQDGAQSNDRLLSPLAYNYRHRAGTRTETGHPPGCHLPPARRRPRSSPDPAGPGSALQAATAPPPRSPRPPARRTASRPCGAAAWPSCRRRTGAGPGTAPRRPRLPAAPG